MGVKTTHRPYRLEEYDPQWKEIYVEQSNIICSVLKEEIIEIEHIGSTSIEGMVAKPNVDILVVVKDLKKIPQFYDQFTELGYTCLGNEYVGNGDEYIVKDNEEGRRLVSIHIFDKGNPQINRYREFREYLKVNTADRELYIQTKKDLFAVNLDNYKAYDSGKKEVIEGIKKRAKEWADIHLYK